jgi:hypothetical protein
MTVIPFLKRIVRTEGFRAVAILIGVLHVAFFPSIWGDRTLLASSKDVPSIMPTGAWAGPPSPFLISRSVDAAAGGVQGEPNLPLLLYQYVHERVVPLWDPYLGYGTPLAADQQSQPFYPLTLALLLHIGPRTCSWFLLARLFLAGVGSCFFLRFFVSFWAAIAAGITSMLAGYYILLLTIPHLSVEVVLPASLFAAEYLLRQRTYSSFVAFVIALLLVFLGGMPESALLLFTLLYSYILFRIVSNAELRSSWPRAIGRLLAATCAGVALAAFFLLPFWEFMHRSFDNHQSQNLGGAIAGEYRDVPGQLMFTYLFPLLHGPPGTAISGVRNYVGLAGFFLAVISVVAVLGKQGRKDRSLLAITWFFFSFTILVELKRYGFAPVNALGRLPYFQFVVFPKYGEALVSICVSILSAIGVERLLRHDVSARVQKITLAATALLIPLAIVVSRQSLRQEFVQMHLRHRFPNLALGLPTLLMIGMAVLLALSWKWRAASGPSTRIDMRLGIGLAALVTAEMSLSLLVPVHYWYNKLAPMAHNAFAGAPYIDALKKVSGNYRVFGRGGVLFPNWASAFRLYDIRNLDPMYDKKYLPFVRNFFSDQKNISFEYDLGDRFLGIGSYSLTTPLAERLLQLSSVKYIASALPFTIPNRMIDEILQQNLGHLIPGKEAAVVPRLFLLSGEVRNTIGEHSPYERMPYRIRVPNDPQKIFVFSYALDPAAFDKTSTDGVEFIVELKDPSGRISKQFSRYIDPKHNAQERRWMDGQIDLSAYRNQTVELLFTTTPGPKGNTAYDWAAWSNFHFEGQAEHSQALPFHLIYSAEAAIYRYDDVLPRAAIYYHSELVSNENEALRKLLDPSLNIFKSVVLNEAALTANQRAQVAGINGESPAPVQAALIRSYASQDVQIEAALDRSGILVLNDTAYPGWVAEVDGRPAEWVNANYLFRGVLLSPGKHLVRFRYQPKSFRWGAAISGISFAGLLAFGFMRPMRRRSEPAGSTEVVQGAVH